jgi:hypothetical protein
MSFLPENYETPQGGGLYMKLQNGENKFRIMSKPIIGWIDWVDKTPMRYQYKQKPAKPAGDKPLKHFWAMIVFDYFDKQIKILEITQATIQKSIETLAKDDDWGDPSFYDIKVTKSGIDKETEYKVNPSPKKPISDEQKKAAFERPINLDALFKNGDPLDVSSGEQTQLIFEETPF